jgi:hypothetical protein
VQNSSPLTKSAGKEASKKSAKADHKDERALEIIESIIIA